MAQVAQLVPQYDGSGRAQFVAGYSPEYETTTLVTAIDGGNVDADASTITNPDAVDPLIEIEHRTATGSGWRHLLFALEGVTGKNPTIRFNRATMQANQWAPAVDWLPVQTQDPTDLDSWVQAPSRSLVGGENGYIEFSFTDPLPAGRVYIASQPQGQNAHAAIFAAELLADYSSVVSPTSSADASGVYNTTPAETDEDGRPIGENDQFALKLAWGGPTTDGLRKRKLVMFAGTHAAGENVSWLPFVAAVRWMLDNASTEAQNIRANWDVYIYFNVTPNGITGGHVRTNFRNSKDPNRDFVDQELNEIAALTTAILADTGGSADAQFAWHGYGSASEDFIPGTITGPNAETQAFITNGEAIFTDRREYFYSISSTGTAWAYNTLGCTVAFASENPQRTDSSPAFFNTIGENWIKTLEVTDSQGHFVEGSEQALVPVVSTASEQTMPLVSGYNAALSPVIASESGQALTLSAGHVEAATPLTASAQAQAMSLLAGMTVAVVPVTSTGEPQAMGLTAGNSQSLIVALTPIQSTASPQSMGQVIGQSQALTPEQSTAALQTLQETIGQVQALAPETSQGVTIPLTLVTGNSIPFTDALDPLVATSAIQTFTLTAGHVGLLSPVEAAQVTVTLGDITGQAITLSPATATAAGQDMSLFTGVVIGTFTSSSVTDISTQYSIADITATIQ